MTFSPKEASLASALCVSTAQVLFCFPGLFEHLIQVIFSYVFLKGGFVHQLAHLLKEIRASEILSNLFIVRRAVTLLTRWVDEVHTRGSKWIHVSDEATENGSRERCVDVSSELRQLLMRRNRLSWQLVQRKKKCNYILRVMSLCLNLCHSWPHLLLVFTVLGWVSILT